MLKGRAGADTLIGKGDSDVLVGGRGNDQINDRVDCGRGRDKVLTDNTTEDTIANNCEVIKRG